MWLATHRRNAAIVLEIDSKRTANSAQHMRTLCQTLSAKAALTAACCGLGVSRLKAQQLTKRPSQWTGPRNDHARSRKCHWDPLLPAPTASFARGISGGSAAETCIGQLLNRCSWPTRFQLGEYVYFDEICCFMMSFECYWDWSIAAELCGVDFKQTFGLFFY